MNVWERLSPKAKRFTVITATVGAILLVISLIVPERREASPIVAVERVERIIAPVDERDLNLERLIDEVGRVRTELQESRRELDRLREDNEALRGRLDEVAARPVAAPPPPSPRSDEDATDPADALLEGAIPLAPRQVRVETPGPSRPPAAAGRLATRTLDEIFAGPIGEEVPATPALQRHAEAERTDRPAGPFAQPVAATAIRTIAAPPPDPETAPTPAGEFFLPAGSVLTGHLVTGYVAGTTEFARTNPFPALVRLDDISILPSRFRADMIDCHILISGYGDLSSERVLARAETLACIDRDGEVVEQPLEAFVSGPDGFAGLPGRLVTRDGQVIAQALLVGFAQATASAFGSDTVSLGVNPQTGAFEGQRPAVGSAFLAGAGNALDRIADYYIRTAEKILPVLEVPATTELSLIVSRGSNLRLKDAQP